VCLSVSVIEYTKNELETSAPTGRAPSVLRIAGISRARVGFTCALALYVPHSSRRGPTNGETNEYVFMGVRTIPRSSIIVMVLSIKIG